ncbi:aspartate aminotransferase family protein [Jatrophihabitans telluris]|uniref:Aspartate aminotransferase family protein n=1 Tax=Jatrophihabitans telluris TaxID=2038343 RepID=A0ABY4QWW9_9ACTN|nr:aspartate aminotransferase family protein [Jatrophihabitans telluris]UQX87667.1 aspartate aminotransferase family protein [Jatrophihabitans telluris]
MSTPSDTATTYQLDREYVFHSWSAQGSLTPLVIESAQGSYITDGDGNRLLDLSSQLVNTNIGHQHPKVVAAIKAQADLLCTIAPQHANAARGQAAKLIIERAPQNMRKVFFTNGGAEAVEYAVRMAKLHTGRNKVLSTYRSYHGGTNTAVNLTGDPRRWPNDLGTTGNVHFFGPFLYRSPFHSTTQEEECQRALEHLEQVIGFEGPGSVAAIILETIPGTAGIMPPPPGYLAGVRALADKHGIVMILDEVMAGFGRTGKWFALDHYDVVPDLIAFAKGVNSGYIPLGGVVVSEQILATFNDRVFPGGLTYSGHPLACAAAVATLTAMEEEGIVDNAAMIGETVLGPGLAELAERYPMIGEVRGLGVFWALDLVSDRASRQPLAPYGGSSPAMAELVGALKANGVLPFTNYHRLHVVPPCIITADEAREGLAAIDKALSAVAHHYVG